MKDINETLDCFTSKKPRMWESSFAFVVTLDFLVLLQHKIRQNLPVILKLQFHCYDVFVNTLQRIRGTFSFWQTVISFTFINELYRKAFSIKRNTKYLAFQPDLFFNVWTSSLYFSEHGLETFTVVILRFTKPICLKNLWYPGFVCHIMIFFK